MDEIGDLNEEVKNCNRCKLAETRTHPVPGTGNKDARLFLVGQAPGEVEDEKGEMFVGRSGHILDELLKNAGINREEIYMSNLIKCILPGYRRPHRDEIDTCSGYLDREIEIVNPEVIVPLGYYPARYVLNSYDFDVPEDKDDIFNRIWYNAGQKIYSLGHPAAIVYDKSLKGEMMKDYEKLDVLSRDCKWYAVCPMRRYYEQGRLERKWVETYCKGDWESCQRYKMEEDGEPHPDFMLPDGTTREELRV